MADLPMPDGYQGTKRQWKNLNRKAQENITKALKEEEAANALKNVPMPFIGGMPGGRQYNPNTNRMEGTLPGTQSKLLPVGDGRELYGIDNILPASFQKTAQYVEGDQWKPSGSDFNTKQNLQYKLYQVGLYDSEAEFRVGEWGEEDAKAYEKALSAANSNFMSVDEWLEQAVTNPQMRIQAKGKAARKPLTVVLTDPEDLKATARGVTSTLFGRNVKLPEEFMEQMIAGYHQLQRERQIQNYNMEEVGGEIVDIPDVSSYISQRVEEQYPMQTQQDEFKGAMDSVMQGLFGG